jgi:hypothetical protein
VTIGKSNFDVNELSSTEAAGTMCNLGSLIGWDGATAIGTVVLALLGIVTVLYAKRQLEDFRRESRIKHLIDLVDQFEREPLATHRRALGSKRAPGGNLHTLDLDNPPPELYDVINFFEHMGYPPPPPSRSKSRER